MSLSGFQRSSLRIICPDPGREGVVHETCGDGQVSLFFHDGPGMKEMLASLEIEPEIIDRGQHAPAVSLYQSPDIHGQTFALNRVISETEKAGNLPDEKTVIVLPTSDTLFPYCIMASRRFLKTVLMSRWGTL